MRMLRIGALSKCVRLQKSCNCLRKQWMQNAWWLWWFCKCDDEMCLEIMMLVKLTSLWRLLKVRGVYILSIIEENWCWPRKCLESVHNESIHQTLIEQDFPWIVAPYAVQFIAKFWLLMPGGMSCNNEISCNSCSLNQWIIWNWTKITKEHKSRGGKAFWEVAAGEVSSTIPILMWLQQPAILTSSTEPFNRPSQWILVLFCTNKDKNKSLSVKLLKTLAFMKCFMELKLNRDLEKTSRNSQTG